MTHYEMTARIQKVFGTVFGSRVPFHPDLCRAREGRWTSLKHVELLVALEKEFGVRFDGADATDMISIPVVIEKVGQRLS
jgi:acyl carrier protein